MRPRPARRTALFLAAGTVAAGLLAAPASADDQTQGPTTTREVIGTSVLDRPITVVHRAHEGATRRVLVIGSIHGDERAGMRVVRRLVRANDLPRDLDLWAIRTVNPDGTAADRRTNANGVDLNRNFPYRWHTSSRGETWSGRKPLSEPEAVALRRLVSRVDPALVVTFHQPLFGVGANDEGMRTVRALADGMRLPVRDFNCTGVCYGTFTGWVNHRTDGLAVTVEFGRSAPYWRIRRAAATLLRVPADH
jgi:predicted deacylase